MGFLFKLLVLFLTVVVVTWASNCVEQSTQRRWRAAPAPSGQFGFRPPPSSQPVRPPSSFGRGQSALGPLGGALLFAFAHGGRRAGQESARVGGGHEFNNVERQPDLDLSPFLFGDLEMPRREYEPKPPSDRVYPRDQSNVSLSREFNIDLDKSSLMPHHIRLLLLAELRAKVASKEKVDCPVSFDTVFDPTVEPKKFADNTAFFVQELDEQPHLFFFDKESLVNSFKGFREMKNPSNRLPVTDWYLLS